MGAEPLPIQINPSAIEVEQVDYGREWHGSTPFLRAKVVSNMGEAERAKMFRRRAIRKHPDGRTEQIEWLVMELNGVRVYIDGTDLVMTTTDVNP